MEKSDLREEFEKAKAEVTLSPDQRRRKLIAYAIRTVLAIIMFFIFWEHAWVRWSVLLYIPLNLLGLAAIWGQNPFLNRKIKQAERSIRILILPILFLNFSFAQTSSDYSFFINHSDSLLKAEISVDDLSYYENIKGDKLVLNFSPQSDSIGTLNQKEYLRTLRFGDMPAYAELYFVNLKGNDEKEFVGVLSLAPPLGGISYITIFDSERNDHRVLGQIEAATFVNDLLISFVKNPKMEYNDIKIVSDGFRSVYPTKETWILYVENDSLQMR